MRKVIWPKNQTGCKKNIVSRWLTRTQIKRRRKSLRLKNGKVAKNIRQTPWWKQGVTDIEVKLDKFLTTNRFCKWWFDHDPDWYGLTLPLHCNHLPPTLTHLVQPPSLTYTYGMSQAIPTPYTSPSQHISPTPPRYICPCIVEQWEGGSKN